MSTVSVIVPVYNTEEFLPECMSSILAQTHTDIELLCIDDASTDGSLGVLRSFAEEDKRVNVIAAEKHGNAATARNLGIEQAAGEYICFVDSDDWIDENYIETMLAAAAESNADIVLNTGVAWENPQHRELYKLVQLPDLKTPCFLSRDKAVYSTIDTLIYRLYRRDFFSKYHLRVPDIDATEDLAFHYISHIQAGSFYITRGAAYHYRSRQGSLMHSLAKYDQREVFAARAYAAVFEYCTRHRTDALNTVKMFRLLPSYTISTEEKFDAFKQLFADMQKYGFTPQKPLYNEPEIFFFHSVLSAGTYTQYRSQHGANVLMSFLKRPKGFRA